MKTSIIIVNFRAYQDLAACLTSIDRQGRPPVKTVVVDQDGLGDDFGEVATAFPRVEFVEIAENKGFAYGVNAGAKHASGDALLIVNPDCVLDPDVVARLTDWIEQHPEVGAVGPRILDPNGTRQASARRFPDWTAGVAGRRSWLSRVFPRNRLSQRNLLSRQIGDRPVQVDWVSGACVLVRREAFEEVGGFDVGFFLYWEDADFCRRLLDAGWQTWHHPGPKVTHAVARSSRKTPVRALVAFHLSAFRYYWKHGSTLARALAPVAAALLATRLVVLLAAAVLQPSRLEGHSRGK